MAPSTLPHRSIIRWRPVGWGLLAALLALPAIAMQFTPAVAWTGSDFVIAAILLLALGIGMEIAWRVARDGAQLAGVVLAVIGGFLTVWLNGAVGIIGNEGERVNLGFVALVAAAALGSIAVRLRPAPMMAIMLLLALGQFALIGTAIAQGIGHWQPALMFVAIWGGAALCFRAAARRQAGTSLNRALRK